MRSLLMLIAAALVGGRLPAAEYVPDKVCASCHAPKFASYQGVGMAQSMRRPSAGVLIEDFSKAHVFHEPSRCHYDMEWKNGRLLFRRYQSDAEGRRINVIEEQVDWIVGSGHRARVYLYRTPSGELFQLPIAWYTQEHAWGMAPGYDRADNDGITRPIRRECLFCHNAYPDVPAGSDTHWAPQRFPAEVPEGTGCQRCHGPGSDHVKAATGSPSDEEVRAAIINPSRLSPPLRDSVCFQCHLQPAVELIGARRFERGDYSFRPGEPLSSYMLHVDIDERDRPRSERFEINHHAYRLRQSLCYIKGGITCTSCHDPHQPLKKDPRLANVVTVCLGCHARHTESNDCVRCHMPARRTQDVVHVVMTDHRIQRRPPPGDLIAPLREREPQIEDVQFLDSADAPPGTLGELYRSVIVLRALPGFTAAASFLARHIDATPSVVPRMDLIAAELRRGEYQPALDVIASLGEKSLADPRIREWRGTALIGAGSVDKGLADLRAAAEADPTVAEYHFNLGTVLHRQGRNEDALPALTRAIELRPNFAAAFVLRAETLDALGRRVEAIADLHRAIAVDPRPSRAYAMLGDLLEKTGDTHDAERWRKLGEAR